MAGVYLRYIVLIESVHFRVRKTSPRPGRVVSALFRRIMVYQIDWRAVLACRVVLSDIQPPNWSHGRALVSVSGTFVGMISPLIDPRDSYSYSNILSEHT